MFKTIFKSFGRKLKRNKEQNQKPRRLADVIHRQLDRHYKVWSLGQITRTALLLFAILSVMLSSWAQNYADVLKDHHLAVIQISGDITSADGGTGYTAAKAFNAAIKDEKAAAILISVDSGGGSPTEGELLHQTIDSYVTSTGMANRKPVYVSIKGMCASACYYAISGADIIFAHHNSLVGSIGVRMDAYDVRELAKSIGVSKVTLSSGENKTLLDPFRGVTDGDREILMNTIVKPLHSKFISDIKASRDGKLKLDHPGIFSGMVYPGEQSIALGFVDEIKTAIEAEQHALDNTSATYIKVINKPSFSFSRMLQSAISDGIQGVFARQIQPDG
ncbi:hypothetical protein C9975_04770 [Thalassospira xiamenensis]|nr:hypothetical protein C9975_04770 [Thalassospira xiamenensis]